MELDDEVKSFYAVFNKGSAGDTSEAPRPCEQWFLDNLVYDLSMWSQKLALCMPVLETTTQELDAEALKAFKHISNIMEEHQRLQRHPELYPSAESQSKFTGAVREQVSSIARVMEYIALMSESALRDDDSTRPPPILAKKVGGIWFRLPRPQYQRYPRLHRKHPDNKKPWTKFFDNHDDSGATIAQRLTPAASQMLSTTKFMHRTVERSYIRAGRVVRTWRDTEALVERTGENHSNLKVLHEFRLAEHAGFAPKALANAMDKKGRISLAEVSTILLDFSRRRRPANTDLLNIRTMVRR